MADLNAEVNMQLQGAGLIGSASVFQRTYFSASYLRCAAGFSRQAYSLETASVHIPLEDRSGDIYQDHLSAVLGAVLLSAASIEAFINELFADCSEDHSYHIHGLEPEVIRMFKSLWSNVSLTSKAPILDKYRLALSVAGKEELKMGLSPAQDVSLLIDLRNTLMHYKPEFVELGASVPVERRSKLEQRLTGRFASNCLAPPGSAFFPTECLGHGCAEWAVQRSFSFLDSFCKTMGLTKSAFQQIGALKTR